jgi:hypothetical protein
VGKSQSTEGNWFIQRHALAEGFEGFSLAIFTRLLGWSKGNVDKLLAEVRAELFNGDYPWHWPLQVLRYSPPNISELTNSLKLHDL